MFFRELPEAPAKVWQQGNRPMVVNNPMPLFDLRQSRLST